MSYQPHYIASFEGDSGLFNYYEPFLIPEKAFVTLRDAYCWRGKVKKRLGVTLLGRLRRQIASSPVTLTNQASGASYTVTDLLADPAINVRAPSSPVIPEPNAEIQSGTVAITVGGVTFADNGDGTLKGTPGTNSGTINYITGALSLSFSPSLGSPTNVVITFYYYPALPVLGLPTLEVPGNVDQDATIAFDQKYSYFYASGAFQELVPGETPWQGPDYSQFDSTNYWIVNGNQLLWTTNFNPGANGDPIRYYDGSVWNDFTPAVDASDKVQTCRIIVAYKSRLLLLNTWELNTGTSAYTNYPNRVRWSWIGDPTDQTDGWLDSSGHGGHFDAPIGEAIVGAEFINDVLLVKFERSSWKLAYTGNSQLPFVWQKIDSEFGSEATFSLVHSDRTVFTIGNRGITADDSVSVQRVDLQIPQQIFQISAVNFGVFRISGIRDFQNELIYWAYPDSIKAPDPANLTFPNQVIVYNYVNKTYALFSDSYTALGFFQPPSSGDTWDTTMSTWASNHSTWNSNVLTALQPQVAAGNQQGFVVMVSQPNKGANDSTLAITAISGSAITTPNHNLSTGTFVTLSGGIGIALAGNYKVVRIDENTINVISSTGTETFFGTYLGGGQAAIIQNFDIQTKVFAPFYEQGSQCRLGYADFLLTSTSGGQCQINAYVDESDDIPMNDPSTNPSMMGDNILLTQPESTTLPIVRFQSNQDKIWHRKFFQTVCQNFQLEFTMNDAQMFSTATFDNDFVIHAMAFYLSPNARLEQ